MNALIDTVYRIWEQTANNRYTRLDGVPYALPGAAQMIFSDLGTLAAEETRGFSAYRWIKDSLIARGVPAGPDRVHAGLQKSSAKQQLFNAVNAGQVRVLIGSSETMGTGVNAQRRLKALHHLDVPWLPSQIEQREGRIERQGNENAEIELYAYATKRSVDATGWQILERKARFIDAAMSGDRSVRRIEDAGIAGEPVRPRQGDRLGRRTAHAARRGFLPKSPGSSACATAISTISSPSAAR